MDLSVAATGLTLGPVPASVQLADKGKATVEIPVAARETGVQTLTVTLTTPDGRRLEKTLSLPVEVNDPETARTSRFTLAPGQTFTFDGSVFAGLRPAPARPPWPQAPSPGLNAPGLLAALDRYPFGCTEQITSRALPLLYLDETARLLELPGSEDLQARLTQAVEDVLTNQSAEGGFGAWGPGSGDFWLDAYVTDFLSRARAQGIAVPDTALRAALDNLRNQVNYAPDFEPTINGGGEALAYALMVLAREARRPWATCATTPT